MDFETYKTAVKTTESKLDSDHLVDKPVLHNLFKAIDGLSDALDLLKKRLFYSNDKVTYDMVAEKVVVAIDDANTLLGLLDSSADSVMTPVSNIRLLHSLLGSVGEAGELAKVGAIMTAPGEDQPIDALNLLEEWGDGSWYQTIGLDELGFTRDQMDEANVAKLKKRYPEGFSAEKAVDRDYVAERVALEVGVKDGSTGKES